MGRQQTSLERVINLTTGLVILYLLTVLVLPWPALVFALSGLALVATAWMALRILKDPYSTNKSFDEQFYQDRDDIRRSGSK